MTGHVTENWRLLAQSIGALADHIDGAIGYQLAPVTFADLPPDPLPGMVACISDSNVNAWGEVITGGGPYTVEAFYDGTNWVVAAARAAARGAFKVRLGANQVVTSATFTLVSLSIVEANVNGWWNAALNRYTPQVPGYYILSATCGSSTGNAAGVNLVKNGLGVGTDSANSVFAYAGGKIGSIMSLSSIVAANGSTDYFEIYGAVDDTPTATITHATFNGARVA